MEDFDSELFNYSKSIDQAHQAAGFFQNEGQPLLPYDFASIHGYDGSTSSFSRLPPVPELDTDSITLPTEPAFYTPNNLFPKSSDSYTNAGSRPFTAQEAGPPHLSKFFPELNSSWGNFDLNMADLAEDNGGHSQPSESTPIDENAPLVCIFDGCPEKRAFHNQSALRRHRDKHVRPYICAYPSCNQRSFGDKGGLHRHQREVHSSQAFTCPVPSCPRSKKAFNRRYNLLEHQRRKHKLQPSRFLRARSDTMEQLSGSEDGTQTLQCEDDIVDSDKDTVDRAASDTGGGGTMAERSLRSKLRDLQSLRAEMVADIDEDIISLQKALHIISAASQ